MLFKKLKELFTVKPILKIYSYFYIINNSKNKCIRFCNKGILIIVI